MNWPIDIVEKIAKRKAILFLGAGISANAVSLDGSKHPPTWEQFIRIILNEIDNTAIKKYVDSLLKEKDYLTACEVLVNQIGNIRFEKIARDQFLAPKYKSHKIHENILKLDARIVITPSVDKIYEDMHSQKLQELFWLKNIMTQIWLVKLKQTKELF